MGLAEPLEQFLRFDGLRSIAHGVTLELAWPEHPDFPPYGYVVRRRDLDEMVAERAVKAGATLWPGAEAVAPLVEDGLVTGAVDRARRDDRAGAGPQYVVVADGANSRFGRALGTARDRTLPAGHGDPRLLHQPVPRRAVDREPPRPARPRRQPPARATAGSSRWATAR